MIGRTIISLTLTMLIQLFFLLALWLEEAAKHRAVDPVFSNLQKTTISLGSTRRTSRKFQGRAGSRNDIEKVMSERRNMF